MLGLVGRQAIPWQNDDSRPSLGWRPFHLWQCVQLYEHLDHLLMFLVLYAIGIVELELESTSALILLLFVIPLAFTLSGFLLWIMYSLNGTWTVLIAGPQADMEHSNNSASTYT